MPAGFLFDFIPPSWYGEFSSSFAFFKLGTIFFRNVTCKFWGNGT